MSSQVVIGELEGRSSRSNARVRPSEKTPKGDRRGLAVLWVPVKTIRYYNEIGFVDEPSRRILELQVVDGG